MNIVNDIYKVARKIPDKICIIQSGNKISYSELLNRIDNLETILLRMGIREKDKVALILPNSLDLIVSFLCILKINAIAVPLEPIYVLREYQETFSECNPKLLITTSAILMKSLVYDAVLLENKKILIADKCKFTEKSASGNPNFSNVKIRNIGYNTSLDELLGQPSNKTNAPALSIDHNLSYSDIPESSEYDKEIISDDDHIASINYTYRGFGYHVGALLTHENYLAGAEALTNIGKNAKTFFSLVPMAHIYGLIAGIIIPLLRGIETVIITSLSPRSIFKTIENTGIEFLISVPQLYTYLMQHFEKDKYDISSLKYCISGGSFLSAQTHEQIEQTLGIDLYQGYGLTEGLIVSCNRTEDNKPGTLGLPAQGISIKIADNNFNDLGVNKKGQILIHGPTVMKGYFRKEYETNQVLKHGWLCTGDYGHFDEQGYLYYDGLKKPIANISGHCADLKEIERILLMHPHIIEAKAHTQDDELLGHRISVEVTTDKETAEHEIREFCYSRISCYKMPKNIIIS
ncbi:class I adenylate-forming enzyme family protein [Elusimicrobiota bacterium]